MPSIVDWYAPHHDYRFEKLAIDDRILALTTVSNEIVAVLASMSILEENNMQSNSYAVKRVNLSLSRSICSTPTDNSSIHRQWGLFLERRSRRQARGTFSTRQRRFQTCSTLGAPTRPRRISTVRLSRWMTAPTQPKYESPNVIGTPLPSNPFGLLVRTLR